MLFDGERRHDNGGDAGETEPVFALDAFERLEGTSSPTPRST
jgi:hypothetical protein